MASGTVRETVRGIHHRRPRLKDPLERVTIAPRSYPRRAAREAIWSGHLLNDVSDDLPVGTHREWCGAECEPDTSPPKPRTHATAPAPAPGGQTRHALRVVRR